MWKINCFFYVFTLNTMALMSCSAETAASPPITQEASMDTFSADEICQTLEKQFYLSIPYDLSRSVINETIDAFLAFAQTEQKVKDHLQSKLPGIHRRGELGFTHREGTDQDHDTKDFFHYHPYLKKNHAEYISANPIVKRLITQVDLIWNHAEHTTKRILKSLDGNYPGVFNKIFNAKEPHIVLRLVYYQATPDQQILARAHFDAGSFTLAVGESAPGLRIGSHQENLQLVPHEEGRALFMLGANYRQVIASETLSPGWHDVIRVDNLQSRWAIVAFIDGNEIESPSREDTHNKN